MSLKEPMGNISEYIRINRNFEKAWFHKVKKSLDAKVSSLIGKINEDGLDAGIRYLTLDLGNVRLRKVIEGLYIQVGMRHAIRSERRLRAEIQKSSHIQMQTKRFGSATAWQDFIKEYLRMFITDKITFRVNETTRNKLLSVMNESIEKGWGISETVKHLEQLPFTAHQAARIVRTEVNRAANVGIKAQGTAFEYELMKKWISVQDRRTRGVDPKDHADHFHMNGQTVDFYSDFSDVRSGYSLSEPGDPKAPAVDTVECRCNHTTIPKRDADGKLIPKQSRITVIRNFSRQQQTIVV